MPATVSDTSINADPRYKIKWETSFVSDVPYDWHDMTPKTKPQMSWISQPSVLSPAAFVKCFMSVRYTRNHLVKEESRELEANVCAL